MAWIEKRERKGRGSKSGPAPKSYAVYKCYWRDPAGKVCTKTFDRKADAERYGRKIETSKDTGNYIDPDAGKIPLSGMFDHMMETSTHLRPTTRAKYEYLGRLYIDGQGLEKIKGLGDREIRTISKRELKEFLTGLETKEGKHAPTVEVLARLLHRVFEVAVEEDEIQRNPMHGVKVVPAVRRQPRFLSEQEVAAIADNIDERYRALIWTLALGGLRIGEASALRVRNLDLKTGTIRVVESSTEVGGHMGTGPTKSGKDRTVDIPPELGRMLGDHLERFRNRFDKESHVFTGPDGGQLRRTAFRARVFQPAALTAGITPRPTVHDLRHTAASFYAEAGLTMLEAGLQLGHSTTTMTAHYSHIFKEHRQQKIAALDGLMGAVPQT